MATANASAYPLAGPTVNGSTITVDTMLNQPTHITPSHTRTICNRQKPYRPRERAYLYQYFK
jgi:hypothetical protein